MASTLRFDNWENSNGDLINSFENPAIYRGKNLLYNGAMQVAQRGTSETGITGSSYNTADRYQISISSLGTWTQTVEGDGPTGSGFTKSIKTECTTADGSPGASGLVALRQYLEGKDVQNLKKGTADAESLTLSFWVKSNVTGTYIVEFRDHDTPRFVSASYSVVSSGTWERKTITIPGDTVGVLNNDANTSFSVQFWLAAGSNYTSGTLQTSWGSSTNANRAVGQTNLAASTGNYFQITGVQLETGTVANNFDHKSYGVELAECQRYYFRSNSFASAYSSISNYAGIYVTTAKNASSWLWAWSYFPFEMRSAPTVRVSDTDGTIGKITHWTSSGGGSASNQTPYTVYPNKNSLTVSDYITSGIYGFNYHLEADAEL